MLATDNTVSQTYMSSYHIADMTVSKSFLSKHFTVSMGCKNLFDVQNVANNLVGGGAHTASATSAAIGTGRYYFLQTGINF
jgi:outer membrane receptor for ferrienterochelin and colicins